jgi:hypothetical protein
MSARWASSTAVSNPKHLSMSRMSLSMDLGTPMTEQMTLLRCSSAWMAAAPALPPLPPTTKQMSIPMMSICLTIFLRGQRRGAARQSGAGGEASPQPAELGGGAAPGWRRPRRRPADPLA